MFAIHFDDDELQRRLEAAPGKIQEALPDMLHLIGVQLLSFAALDYDTKSRGGTGTDGISWAPLAASTIAKKNRRGKQNAKRKTTKSGKARPGPGSSAIGIDTGLQRASASPGFSAVGGGNILRVDADSVTIGFNRTYSQYFDEERKLLPTQLPPDWERDISETVKRQAERILKEMFE